MASAAAAAARETLAPAGVRDAVEQALHGFPERARRNMHRCRCRVPARVAALLRAEPQLIVRAVPPSPPSFQANPLAHESPRCHVHDETLCVSPFRPTPQAPAVSAFYERDPTDMSAASRMSAFPPTDMVTVPVRMTRVLYAMLSAQRFDPPKRGFPMPEPKDNAYPAALLGLKLTVRRRYLSLRLSSDSVWRSHLGVPVLRCRNENAVIVR